MGTQYSNGVEINPKVGNTVASLLTSVYCSRTLPVERCWMLWVHVSTTNILKATLDRGMPLSLVFLIQPLKCNMG
jgi:hypothetical protein